MKLFSVAVILLCVTPVLAAPVAETPVATPNVANPVAAVTFTDIIEKEGQFIFSDGSSFYMFKKDGTFKLSPSGISGRTIEGTWKANELSERSILIEGVWGWDNGISALNDHRKMTIFVYPRGTFKTVDYLRWPVANKPYKIYDCYFEIEELVKVPKVAEAKSSAK